MSSKFSRIFMPGKIGKLEIKNRVINSASIPNYSKRDGSLTQREADYYIEKAKGGLGAVFLSATSVDGTYARGFICQPSLYADKFIPPYKAMNDEIHKYGAKVGIQIYHAGRSTHPLVHGQDANESPTPLECPFFSSYLPGYKVKEMTTERIQEVVQEFADTALICKKAGFDIVEIHGAHGYLPCSFLSPYYGKRTINDGYGPPYWENDFRFHREMIKAIRDKCGDDLAVGIRFSADEFVEGGLTIEDGKKCAKAFEEMGFDYLGVSQGVYRIDLLHLMVPSGYIPPLMIEPLAAAVREVTTIPLTLYGRVSSPEMAEDALTRGNCDFIIMNRASWADPHFFNKTLAGKEDEIRHCIYCNNGCLDRLYAGLDTCCTMNPELGRERFFNEKLKEAAPKRKNVLVVGGGPGGMSCARYAKLRGHDVTLVEKNSELGGLNKYAQKGEGRGDFEEVTRYYSREIEKLGVDIRLSTEATPDYVLKMAPDAVVIATGSVAKIPIVKGIRKPDGSLADNVVTAFEVLGDEKKTGDNVVIIGGTHIGIQTAFYLLDMGKKVTIIEALQELNQDMDGPYIWKGHLMPKLKKSDIKVITWAFAKEITPKGVLWEPPGVTPNALDVGVVGTVDAEQMIPCDTVVVGAGREPVNYLFSALQGKVPELYKIGDSVKPRWTYSATGEGALVAVDL